MKKGFIVTVVCLAVVAAYLLGSDLSGLHTFVAAEPKPGG